MLECINILNEGRLICIYLGNSGISNEETLKMEKYFRLDLNEWLSKFFLRMT